MRNLPENCIICGQNIAKSCISNKKEEIKWQCHWLKSSTDLELRLFQSFFCVYCFDLRYTFYISIFFILVLFTKVIRYTNSSH